MFHKVTVWKFEKLPWSTFLASTAAREMNKKLLLDLFLVFTEFCAVCCNYLLRTTKISNKLHISGRRRVNQIKWNTEKIVLQFMDLICVVLSFWLAFRIGNNSSIWQCAALSVFSVLWALFNFNFNFIFNATAQKLFAVQVFVIAVVVVRKCINMSEMKITNPHWIPYAFVLRLVRVCVNRQVNWLHFTEVH